MSQGDRISQGGKGTNYPFQSKNLKGLQQSIEELQQISSNTAGLATEATLLDVLAAIDLMRDYEVRLVVDSDTPPVTWLEVRYWDAQSGSLGTPVYYLPGSTVPGTPVGPIEYINPNTFLAQLVTNTTGINLEATQQLVKGVLDTIKVDTANLDVALSTRASESTLNTVLTTLGSILAQLDVDLSTRASEATLALVKAVLDTIKTDTENMLTSLATEATLLDVETAIDTVNTNLSPAVRAHNTVSATGAGSVPAGSLRGSILNFGDAAGTWNGISLPAGVSLPWGEVGNRDTYGAINYDATGTTFIIEYTT